MFPSHQPRPDEESDSTEWETDTDASDDEEADGEQACMYNRPEARPEAIAPFGVPGRILLTCVVVPVSCGRNDRGLLWSCLRLFLRDGGPSSFGATINSRRKLAYCQVLKPVFVPKARRETAAERVRLEEEEKDKQQKRNIEKVIFAARWYFVTATGMLWLTACYYFSLCRVWSVLQNGSVVTSGLRCTLPYLVTAAPRMSA